jgi:GrpB-like predicted nucleotidyltransferase (UPF0157 family)
MSKEQILIVDYDPQWPDLFGREANRIRTVLGSRVLQIEHSGSSSVPGLAAKPIVDMLLVIIDSSDEDAYAPALEAAGYLLRVRESDWYEHRMFNGPDTDINLHVFSSGCPEIDRVLRFRIGCALTTPIAIYTCAPSWISPAWNGSAFRTMPMQRLWLLRKSSPER